MNFLNQKKFLKNLLMKKFKEYIGNKKIEKVNFIYRI